MGDRCLALHRRAGTAELGGLRAATLATRGGVLVSCGCLGRCDLAAVVLLGWTGPAPGPLVPLAGMDDPARMDALTGWLSGPGPARLLPAAGRAGPLDLPPPLAAARTEALHPPTVATDLTDPHVTDPGTTDPPDTPDPHNTDPHAVDPDDLDLRDDDRSRP
jgi:hypothetical protein